MLPNISKSNFTLSILVLLFTTSLLGQKPQPNYSLEFNKLEPTKAELNFVDNKRINTKTNLPAALYNLNYKVTKADPIDMAKEYLAKNQKIFSLQKNDLSDLKHHATRETNAGSVVRFRQTYQGVPVNKSEITISIDPKNHVQFVMNGYESDIKLADVNPTISAEDALDIAAKYINPTSLMIPSTSQLMIFHNERGTRLCHEVVILASTPSAEWHVLVDAKTGEIFKAKNELHYNCSHKKNNDPDHKNCNHENKSASVVVDGTGFIFDPDPLSSNTVAYGGNYSDNNDATNANLDAARFLVTLKDIENTGGTFKLKGPWAEIVDIDAPTTGLYTQNSSVFEYNRSDQEFEAVNCYYHIDHMMRYVNITLGCNIQPSTVAVRFDPHGANGADQSFYTSANESLVFGEGCVDDGEDSDVIHHELGHGLHDWVTNGGLSQVNGLSEGCGDYIAQSYNRGLGYWGPNDPAYNWIFNWDGHNECWAGRISNSTSTYPGGLTGGVHADGQIWSTCLMGIWDDIGQQQMDKIFYEGLGMTNSSTNQNDAANAVYQAAINLGYNQAELTAIHAGFTACGYTLPALPSDPDDAGISAIVAPVSNLCNASFTPIVTLSNFGSNALTSAIIVYNIDGGANMTFAWTGNLSSLASIDITLPSLSTSGGAHTFNADATLPNGMTDSNPSNDNETTNFNVTIGGQSISLILISDDYGSETTWVLQDSNGAQIDSGGPYANNTTYMNTWCLADGCYDFIIDDTANDGICCGFGNGSYQFINNTDGTSYFTGGNFGSTQTENFCVVTTNTCADDYAAGGSSNSQPALGTGTGDSALNLDNNADFETPGDIHSTQIIGATNNSILVDYDAGDCILLLPGFEVILGVEFDAFIDNTNCNGTGGNQ